MVNKIQRKEMRAGFIDYSLSGYYFITTVTENRDKILGFLEDDEVVLTQYGEICKNSWLRLTDFYHNLQIDELSSCRNISTLIREITDRLNRFDVHNPIRIFRGLCSILKPTREKNQPESKSPEKDPGREFL